MTDAIWRNQREQHRGCDINWTLENKQKLPKQVKERHSRQRGKQRQLGLVLYYPIGRK